MPSMPVAFFVSRLARACATYSLEMGSKLKELEYLGISGGGSVP